jgi:hypothetical protein
MSLNLIACVLLCLLQNRDFKPDTYPKENGMPVKLYSDDQARRMAKKAKTLFPDGKEHTKRDVLQGLGISPKRMRGYKCHGGMGSLVEWWQISPGYELEWSVNVGEDLDKPACPVYFIEIKPIEKNKG